MFQGGLDQLAGLDGHNAGLSATKLLDRVVGAMPPVQVPLRLLRELLDLVFQAHRIVAVPEDGSLQVYDLRMQALHLQRLYALVELLHPVGLRCGHAATFFLIQYVWNHRTGMPLLYLPWWYPS